MNQLRPMQDWSVQDVHDVIHAVKADAAEGLTLKAQSADTIFDLMRSVSQTSGTTFLIVTHDPRLARRCDRIVELVDVRIDSDKPNTATQRGDGGGQAAHLPA